MGSSRTRALAITSRTHAKRWLLVVLHPIDALEVQLELVRAAHEVKDRERGARGLEDQQLELGVEAVRLL